MGKIQNPVTILIQRILQIQKNKKSKHQILGNKACTGRAGGITYNVKTYLGDSKHSCIQDAAINAGIILDLNCEMRYIKKFLQKKKRTLK